MPKHRVQPKAGAPPGNVNALKHPARTFWSRRALRERDKWVLFPYQHYLDGLLRSDNPDASEAQTRVAEIAATARACQMLLMADLREVGRLVTLPDGRVEVNGLVKELRQFASLERSALESFGLDRKPRPIKNLSDVVASIAAKKDGATP